MSEEMTTKIEENNKLVTEKRNKRLIYIDIAKGIGIVLMIIGHCGIDNHPYIKNIIYCFHMPLFFIISGYFFKVRENKECIKNIWNRLIKPYIITCGVIIFYKIFRQIIARKLFRYSKCCQNMDYGIDIWKWQS